MLLDTGMSSLDRIVEEVFGRFDGHITELEGMVQRVGVTEWSDSEYEGDPFYLPPEHSHFHTQEPQVYQGDDLFDDPDMQELLAEVPPLEPLSPILVQRVRFSDEETVITEPELPGIRVLPLQLFEYDSDGTVPNNWTPEYAICDCDSDCGCDADTVVGEYEEPWTTP